MLKRVAKQIRNEEIYPNHSIVISQISITSKEVENVVEEYYARVINKRKMMVAIGIGESLDKALDNVELDLQKQINRLSNIKSSLR